MTYKLVIMRQISNSIWYIENTKGTILQKDIVAHGVYEAENYIKRWVSSFPNWEYQLILLRKD